MPDQPLTTGRDELYVGYLPVPPRQRSFLRRAVPVTLWLVCAASFLWARSQHSPGTAVWDDGQPVKLRGVIATMPYPILFAEDAGDGAQAVLLVEAGKHGSRRTAALNGRAATVSGWPLHRDGRRMLELEPTDTAVVADEESALNALLPPLKPVGPVTLRGEIVDSKCFLGAMKPGEGKTHKECATLCIRGGIPPMFVSRDANGGAATYYLLQDPGGGPIDPAIFPLIADPVEIKADLATWGGLNILNVRPESIRRL